MKLFLLSALLVVASGCHRAPVAKVEVKPPEPSAAETEFIRAGMKLQEYCAQGVAIDRFAEQLATVKVAFRLVQPEMNSKNAMRMVSFQSALVSWDQTLAIWNRQIRGTIEIRRSEISEKMLEDLGLDRLRYSEPTPRRLAYMENPGEQLFAPSGTGKMEPFGPPPTVLNTNTPLSCLKLIRIGLTEGSTRFQYAIDFVDVATEVEKARRAGGGK